MLSASLFAQNTDPEIHYYYIEEANHDLLNPTKVIENANGTITLEFRDNTVESFLNQFEIHYYDREFEWSRFTSLHKYYIIGIESAHQVNALLANSGIVMTEYIGTDEDTEVQTLGTPNDYYDHVHIPNYWIPNGTYIPGDGSPYQIFDFRAYEHLEQPKYSYKPTTNRHLYCQSYC